MPLTMQLTATHINYYHICHRKLWLFANGINMEHTSEIVAEGKLIGETTYPQRPEKYTEVEVGGSKIDFYDAKNKIIHEIKKSNKAEEAHEWQVKYYIWLLQQNGVRGVTGPVHNGSTAKFANSARTMISVTCLNRDFKGWFGFLG